MKPTKITDYMPLWVHRDYCNEIGIFRNIPDVCDRLNMSFNDWGELDRPTRLCLLSQQIAEHLEKIGMLN